MHSIVLLGTSLKKVLDVHAFLKASKVVWLTTYICVIVLVKKINRDALEAKYLYQEIVPAIFLNHCVHEAIFFSYAINFLITSNN